MHLDLGGPIGRLPIALLLIACLIAPLGCVQTANSQPPAEREPAAEPAPEGAAEVGDPQEAAEEQEHPYPRRIEALEFPQEANWLNVAAPLRLKRDLKGKFVLLDFWTYCCINCIQSLPELKKLEKKYPDALVVIGVHSAKFDTEKEDANIREAILRYDIEHPVVNDAKQRIWNSYGVQAWPTLLLIDPEGNAVWGKSGEAEFEQLDRVIQRGIDYYRERGTLDEKPIRFELAKFSQPKTPLRFPGKVLADPSNDRLFIADSSHNRLVVTSKSGEVLDVIGTGAVGQKDGGYTEAQFHKPQGMALLGETLYVSDTENHLLRKIDLQAKRVVTIAGTGRKAESPWPGLEELDLFADPPERWVGKPLQTGLASPWALWVHRQDLYIAMAGPHQIWKMPLDESEIGPYAGNGREDIVDGPLLPKQPYRRGFASFAQPSGLASDGKFLYVADSEGSSIRAVPFDPTQHVKTVVGPVDLAFGRLFEFGDVDGKKEEVRLQHPLGVAYHAGELFVADTYNNKIKRIDLKTSQTQTLLGTGEPGKSDIDGTFDEPAGLSYADGKLYVADTNNHAIRVVTLGEDPDVATLKIEGLQPPKAPALPKRPNFRDAQVVKLERSQVGLRDGKISLKVKLRLPEGWKINPLAPMFYYVEPAAGAGPVSREALEQRVRLQPPDAAFVIELPAASGQDELRVAVRYYYCQEGGEGLCKVGSVLFEIPLEIGKNGGPATLTHAIQP